MISRLVLTYIGLIGLLSRGLLADDVPWQVDHPTGEDLCDLINDYRVANGLAAIPYSLALMTVASKMIDNHLWALYNNVYWEDSSCNEPQSWFDAPDNEWSDCCYTGSDESQRSCVRNRAMEMTADWDLSGFVPYPWYAYLVFADGANFHNIQDAFNYWISIDSIRELFLEDGEWRGSNWPAIGCAADTDVYFYRCWIGYGPDENAYPMFTLSPTPYTPEPTSYTSEPTHYTREPTPVTGHPSPYTWNPTRQTYPPSFTDSPTFFTRPPSPMTPYPTVWTPSPTKNPTTEPTRNPTTNPTRNPTTDPTRYPTTDPTRNPTTDPTRYPTTDPTRYPTTDPTRNPTTDPTRNPTSDPTRYPTTDPTRNPTTDPTRNPTTDPTRNPTTDPTRNPTTDPTRNPTTDPTRNPTTDPTRNPTTDPTRNPTTDPTRNPTTDPTRNPTTDPTRNPTTDPTRNPTVDPTRNPTTDPTRNPTTDPTRNPTTDPTRNPTTDPTRNPTTDPTRNPTTDPTRNPTTDPTRNPTTDPTRNPTTDPTRNPTTNPTRNPTTDPTRNPTTDPTRNPTTDPTRNPTTDPTRNPTTDPTRNPTTDPTRNPTTDPTRNPTTNPTRKPTTDPTRYPTSDPTRAPTPPPTDAPTIAPTDSPTQSPTSIGCLDPVDVVIIADAGCKYRNRQCTAVIESIIEIIESFDLSVARFAVLRNIGAECTRILGLDDPYQGDYYAISDTIRNTFDCRNIDSPPRGTCLYDEFNPDVPTTAVGQFRTAGRARFDVARSVFYIGECGQEETCDSNEIAALMTESDYFAGITYLNFDRSEEQGAPGNHNATAYGCYNDFDSRLLCDVETSENVTNSEFARETAEALKRDCLAPPGLAVETVCGVTRDPTRNPTVSPTRNPTTDPTRNPTTDPTRNPTSDPTRNPTTDPTRNPTTDPTRNPTTDPTRYPTTDPTRNPTTNPTRNPTTDPTRNPTTDPTRNPTTDPTRNPTTDPTRNPTTDPTRNPTTDPTRYPTTDPTRNPTTDPTRNPTTDPTRNPTTDPTRNPTTDPTPNPTTDPTRNPTTDPTRTPSDEPTYNPTRSPTFMPTKTPTRIATPPIRPSLAPTKSPLFPQLTETPEPTRYTRYPTRHTYSPTPHTWSTTDSPTRHTYSPTPHTWSTTSSPTRHTYSPSVAPTEAHSYNGEGEYFVEKLNEYRRSHYRGAIAISKVMMTTCDLLVDNVQFAYAHNFYEWDPYKCGAPFSWYDAPGQLPYNPCCYKYNHDCPLTKPQEISSSWSYPYSAHVAVAASRYIGYDLDTAIEHYFAHFSDFLLRDTWNAVGCGIHWDLGIYACYVGYDLDLNPYGPTLAPSAPPTANPTAVPTLAPSVPLRYTWNAMGEEFTSRVNSYCTRRGLTAIAISQALMSTCNALIDNYQWAFDNGRYDWDPNGCGAPYSWYDQPSAGYPFIPCCRGRSNDDCPLDKPFEISQSWLNPYTARTAVIAGHYDESFDDCVQHWLDDYGQWLYDDRDSWNAVACGVNVELGLYVCYFGAAVDDTPYTHNHVIAASW